MTRKFLLISSVVLFTLVGACKARRNNSGVKEEVKGGKEVQQGALDVNDVSFLFNYLNEGKFYPDLPVADVWPQTVFEDIKLFTDAGKGIDGTKLGQFTIPENVFKLINDPYGNFPSSDHDKSLAKRILEEVPINIINRCVKNPDGSRACIDPNASSPRSMHREWRIVAARLDLCAGVHDGKVAQCDVELRLSAQPFGDLTPPAMNFRGVSPTFAEPGRTPKDDNGNSEPTPRLMFKESASLIYRIGRLDLNTGDIIDATGRVKNVKEIIADLQRVKKLSPEPTNGQPLGVHPGLLVPPKSKDENFGNAIIGLVKRYTGENGRGLTQVRFVRETKDKFGDKASWTFFQGDVENSHWKPISVTGSKTNKFVRTSYVSAAGGRLFPPPELENSNPISINPIFETDFFRDRKSIDFETADLIPFFNNPGRYGDPDPRVDGKVAASVNNTDCVSCHIATPLAFSVGVRSIDTETNPKRYPSLYTPPVGTTAYTAPTAVPRLDNIFINFGYAASPPVVTGKQQYKIPGLNVFDFTRGWESKDAPVVATRVANESAELVNLINSRFLKIPNPGFTCAGEDPVAAFQRGAEIDPYSREAQEQTRRNPMNHAAVADCLVFDSFRKEDVFAACAKLCGGKIK